MFWDNLSAALLRFCAARGLSYEEVAERCHISPRYFGEIARKHTSPTLRSCLKPELKEHHAPDHQRHSREFIPVEGDPLRAEPPEGVDDGRDEELGDEDGRDGDRRRQAADGQHDRERDHKAQRAAQQVDLGRLPELAEAALAPDPHRQQRQGERRSLHPRVGLVEPQLLREPGVHHALHAHGRAGEDRKH